MNQEELYQTSALPPYAFLLCDRNMRRFAVMSLAIPFLFIILKNLGVELLTSEQANAVLNVISSIWPASEQQYSEVVRQGRLPDANNLVLYYALLLIFSILLTVYVFLLATFNRKNIERPGTSEIVIAIISVPIIVNVLFFDRVKDDLESLFVLYIDRFGYYYIRQWMVVYISWFICATLLVCLVAFSSKPKALN